MSQGQRRSLDICFGGATRRTWTTFQSSIGGGGITSTVSPFVARVSLQYMFALTFRGSVTFISKHICEQFEGLCCRNNVFAIGPDWNWHIKFWRTVLGSGAKKNRVVPDGSKILLSSKCSSRFIGFALHVPMFCSMFFHVFLFLRHKDREDHWALVLEEHRVEHERLMNQALEVGSTGLFRCLKQNSRRCLL